MMANAKPIVDGIEVENVTFRYQHDFEVFRDITFSVPKGEIWGLVGRSGVGKTTLLHLIAGLYKPTSGTIRIAGREVRGPGQIRGMVFQDDCLLYWLNLEDNVLFPNHRKASSDDRLEANKILEAVGLGPYLLFFPAQLSIGMRKRLEFARALVADSAYLLADEPFGPLDVLTRRELWRLWTKLRRSQRRTGLLCTHDPEEAIRLCDAIVPLRRNDACIRIVRVPADIRGLDESKMDSGLWDLRNTIIDILGE